MTELRRDGARHVNIPVFIPHLGCPNMCVFCNQRTISGTAEFDRSSVSRTIDAALATISPGTETEIAFFGGSFTGIDRELMLYLLELAEEYVRAGRVCGIRLSTRPDYIDDEILDILSRYSVHDIELGIQSMDDSVLALCRRGHTAARSEAACRAVKQHGFRLVGQMMTELPGSTVQSELETARAICRLGADGARIYPTVVFYGTELCDMAREQKYRLLPLDESIARAAAVLGVFVDAEVPVLRVGLCASESLADADCVYGGANHSAIGELVMGQLYCDRLEALLRTSKCNGGSAVIAVPRGEMSKAVGQNKRNVQKIRSLFSLCDIKFVEDPTLSAYQVKLKSYDSYRRKDHCI